MNDVPNGSAEAGADRVRGLLDAPGAIEAFPETLAGPLHAGGPVTPQHAHGARRASGRSAPR